MQNVNSSETGQFNHIPVLANEIVNCVDSIDESILKNSYILDLTLGGAGHADILLREFSEIKLIGIDQDIEAICASKKKLSEFGSRVEIYHKNFDEFEVERVFSFILADLGVSSHQIDSPSRGFSFQNNAPIDMRMNKDIETNAADLISILSEYDLAEIIYLNGEERFSRRIAKKIKRDLREKGPYKGTSQLAYAIAGCYPRKFRFGRIHPATKTFQALRIAVNDELKKLDNILCKIPSWLVLQGRVAFISFHSLEDRRVKRSFISNNQLRVITKKPLIATSQETENNPRSRSAKLRIAEKI